MAGLAIEDLRCLALLPNLTLLNLRQAQVNTFKLASLKLMSLLFLNVTGVPCEILSFSGENLPKIKEIFASGTLIFSLAVFGELSTLRLLDAADNEINSVIGLPPLSILNLDESSSCFTDSDSLAALRDMLQQGQLRSLNPPDVTALSCFQNFGELAFGPLSKQAPKPRPTLSETQETLVSHGLSSSRVPHLDERNLT